MSDPLIATSDPLIKLVVGVYGISGSGKTHALSILRKERPEWRCWEGSEVVELVLRERGFDGLAALKNLSQEEATNVRLEAIQRINSFAGVTIVSGHCSFPKQRGSKTEFVDVFTDGDAETYDAIVYLNKNAGVIATQRVQDNTRDRAVYDVSLLKTWIHHEYNFLQRKCVENGIRFEMVQPDDLMDCISTQIFQPMVDAAREKSEKALCRQTADQVPRADVYLLIDGDRTFSPQDTGKLFFEHFPKLGMDPLKTIFQRYPNYNFQAFLEVAMLYASTSPSLESYPHGACQVGLEQVKVSEPWLPFLSNLPSSVHPILVSCSNREIWSAVMEREGLFLGHNIGSMHCSLIAGNHVGLHPYIIDDSAKQLVVKELRRNNPGCKIISFGDSTLDERMLRASDRAYVVLDERGNRSLNRFLESCIRSKNDRVCQMDLNSSLSCNFHDGIRVVSLEHLKEELVSGSIHQVVNVSACSFSAALLVTQTRRADSSAPELQLVHEKVGSLLADKILDEYSFEEALVEEKEFDHVQGNRFSGVVTSRSSNIVILALMRGGEPMARGLFAKFPSAQFVHYYSEEQSLEFCFSDLVQHVFVVDSVVNRGNSVRRVIHRLLAEESGTPPHFCIYVLTGVMHQEAASILPKEFPRVRFLALRVSENQYTGLGGTDTGNRLFGTISSSD